MLLRKSTCNSAFAIGMSGKDLPYQANTYLPADFGVIVNHSVRNGTGAACLRWNSQSARSWAFASCIAACHVRNWPEHIGKTLLNSLLVGLGRSRETDFGQDHWVAIFPLRGTQ